MTKEGDPKVISTSEEERWFGGALIRNKTDLGLLDNY